ncbi:UNVERIFIED_CONTAM: hypothetical protein Sradi_2641500 [Sesamum radiatum]|uniref:Uncharacterized protein n=1 Tax=Sesamum radiatum TaxID=300843 RepID=A0AAW2S5D6_SESRA
MGTSSSSSSKFDALLAHAAKYINMVDARAAKKESRGKRNEGGGPLQKALNWLSGQEDPFPKN